MNKRQSIRRNREKIDELEKDVVRMGKEIELLSNILSELKEDSKKEFKIKTFDTFDKKEDEEEERE